MHIRDMNFYRQVSLLRGHAWKLRSMIISSDLRYEANDFLEKNQERLFFIVGSGRSGTQLISDLLAVPKQTVVFHEPNFREDVVTMESLRQNTDLAIQYWQSYRSIEVYKRWLKAGVRYYGEVNGTIRYQTPAIKGLYPRASFLLMSRDGRGVVRSVMGWHQFYGNNSKGAYALSPLEGDEYFDCWSGMSRFEKVCWLWRETNEFLMQYVPSNRWVQLERITRDYDYFADKVLGSVALDIPQTKWAARVAMKSQNASQYYGFPSWESWTKEQQESFMKICGSTMTKLGYEV